jgi:hypothetical protein
MHGEGKGKVFLNSFTLRPALPSPEVVIAPEDSAKVDAENLREKEIQQDIIGAAWDALVTVRDCNESREERLRYCMRALHEATKKSDEHWTAFKKKGTDLSDACFNVFALLAASLLAADAKNPSVVVVDHEAMERLEILCEAIRACHVAYSLRAILGGYEEDSASVIDSEAPWVSNLADDL